MNDLLPILEAAWRAYRDATRVDDDIIAAHAEADWLALQRDLEADWRL